MRGGRNKFGPMYKRDRARKLQLMRQRQIAAQTLRGAGGHGGGSGPGAAQAAYHQQSFASLHIKQEIQIPQVSSLTSSPDSSPSPISTALGQGAVGSSSNNNNNNSNNSSSSNNNSRTNGRAANSILNINRNLLRGNFGAAPHPPNRSNTRWPPAPHRPLHSTNPQRPHPLSGTLSSRWTTASGRTPSMGSYRIRHTISAKWTCSNSCAKCWTRIFFLRLIGPEIPSFLRTSRWTTR
ncbi:hypothetical protein AAG570_011842 [Ranatra chinensis]|uniref:Nuclear transcription factor Y subunit n=1 Tax=Ranatra chinensis TaxID=642074 RepID=A0ABD0YHD0_9HEMI